MRAAAALGVDRRTISRRENGEIAVPRETVLACAMLELVGGTATPIAHFTRVIPVETPSQTVMTDWRQRNLNPQN